MRIRTYGGVRGRKTKVGGKPTLFSSYSIDCFKNLKNVQTLFLDLFKFILHEYNQLLDLGVVGF